MTPGPELAIDGTIEQEDLSVQHTCAPRILATAASGRLHTVACFWSVHDSSGSTGSGRTAAAGGEHRLGWKHEYVIIVMFC